MAGYMWRNKKTSIFWRIVLDRIKKYIIEVLGHGVTVYKAKGGFKKEKENVLMTVLPTKDYYKLKEGIQNIDQEAFFIITDSYEVFGGE